MKSDLTDLLEMAQSLNATIPSNANNQVETTAWMHHAKDFNGVCITGGQLAPFLVAALPLKVQGQFKRALKAIEDAGSQFSSNVAPAAKEALTLVVSTLNEEIPHSRPGLESSFLPKATSVIKLREVLDITQKIVLEKLWDHYLETGRHCPKRKVAIDLPGVRLSEVLSSISGDLMFEAQDNSVKVIQVTLLGSLMTNQGSNLFKLLAAFTDFIKTTALKDSGILTVSNTDTPTALKLKEEAQRYLFRALTLGMPGRAPFHLSSWGADGTWTASITEEVVDLIDVDDGATYLDSFLAASFDQSSPAQENERFSRMYKSTFPVSFGTSAEANSSEPAINLYIATERIDSIRSSSTKAFDTKRLARLCEEINDCAIRNNAHAVIVLVRAVLDHVPPIFKCKTFAEVANNYPGGKSFGDAMKHLEKVSRSIANMHLHTQIRSTEALPNMTQVTFSQDLDVLLSELHRLLHDQSKA